MKELDKYFEIMDKSLNQKDIFDENELRRIIDIILN